MEMKKFWKGGFAVAMAVAMMACSSGNGASSNNTSSETSSTNAETTTSAEAIKIGISGPLTGGAAVYGQAVKNAIELAVEEVNAQGGVQFEANIQDDAHDPEKAVTAYGQLKDWGMQVSLGTVTSAPGAAVAQLYADDHIFALTPSASSMDVIYNSTTKSYYGTFYHMCFTDPNQGIASADYLSTHTNLGTKVAVIWKNDDNYSTGVHEKFVAEAKEKNLEIVSDETFDTSSASDFTVQLQKAKDAGADILFLPIYYEPASLILTQADAMGYKPTVFGIDGMDGILSLEGFDTKLAEGVYLLTPFSADATDEKTVNFVTKFKEKYGDVPNQFAADAYDCIYALAQACTEGNVTASMSATEITDIMVKQFTSMNFEGITGTEGSAITWAEIGEVSKSPKAMVIQDGAYVGVND